MRNAFTLIEILIAVAIASVVGLTVMKSSDNIMMLFSRLQHNATMSERLSIFGAHGDIKYNHTEKELYDLLRDNYTIRNDEFIKQLKAIKYTYNESIVETITLGEDGTMQSNLEQNISNRMNDTLSDAMPEEAPMIQFEIVGIYVKDSENKGFIYQLRAI